MHIVMTQASFPGAVATRCHCTDGYFGGVQKPHGCPTPTQASSAYLRRCSPLVKDHIPDAIDKMARAVKVAHGLSMQKSAGPLCTLQNQSDPTFD